jgi:hypothetical protein
MNWGQPLALAMDWYSMNCHANMLLAPMSMESGLSTSARVFLPLVASPTHIELYQTERYPSKHTWSLQTGYSHQPCGSGVDRYTPSSTPSTTYRLNQRCAFGRVLAGWNSVVFLVLLAGSRRAPRRVRSGWLGVGYVINPTSYYPILTFSKSLGIKAYSYKTAPTGQSVRNLET